MAATGLSQNLRDLGITLYRFKTGTPARIDRKTVDFSKMEPQYGDEKIVPFSFENKAEDIAREQIECYLTYTNKETHKIIMDNLHRSPLYSGVIEGTGPRYCPSIEDKVVRFADKERHQIFIEPEGENTNELVLDYRYFEIDALVFKDIKSRKVWLNHKTKGKLLEVEFSDYNHLLLWTKPNAKYICIEPWIAVPDMVDSNQDITQKPNVVIVNPKEYKSFIHKIKVI
jgi:hypothetical protein